MRNLLVLVLCLMIHEVLKAQSISIKIAGSYSNTLYVGKKNVIEIKNLPTGAKVKMTHGKVVPIDGGRFYVTEKYCSYPTADTMTVYKGAELLEKKAFRVTYNGDPLIAINGITCLDSIKPSDIDKARVLKILPDSLHYKVTYFEMELIPKRGDWVGPFKSDSEKITWQMMESIVQRLMLGDRVLLQNIKATCTPCSLPDIQIESLEWINRTRAMLYKL